MLLSEEQRMARDTAREFAHRELAPHSADWDRTATFPRDAVKALGRLGFMRKEARWTIMAAHIAWGRNSGQSFGAAAKANNKQIVGELYSPFGTNDFAPASS